MPAVTSSVWRVRFKQQSVVNQETYWIDLSDSVSESDVRTVVANLKKFGYIEVSYQFYVVI